MRIVAALIIALLLQTTAGFASETSHLAFVSEYIHDLVVDEKMRAEAEGELQSQRALAAKAVHENGSTDPVEQNAGKNAAVVRNSTLIVKALTSQMEAMKRVDLNKPFDRLPQTIAGLYRYKIKAHEKFILMATALEGKPQTGVDYKAMGDDLPKIVALLQDFDRTLSQITPVIFATLVEGETLSRDDKDQKNKRLIITKAQRDELVKVLDDGFGRKLDDAKNQGYLVKSAAKLRQLLTSKNYKCSDEK